MRYRKLDTNGDYTFGHSAQDFLVDSPAAVGQAVLTALRLMQGDWFLNTSSGVPYITEVMGIQSELTPDTVIRSAILAVTGVTSIVSYSSTVSNTKFSVAVTTDTEYGTTTVSI